jgi:hypothetical protein
MMTLLCIKFIIAKSKGIKTGCSLAELSEEGRISKSGSFVNGADDGDDADDSCEDVKKYSILKFIPKA